MNYVTLSTSDKKLYRIHKAILDNSNDDHVRTMALNLSLMDKTKYQALRCAVAGTVRARKLMV